MRKSLTILLLLSLILTSCGKSKQELELEKTKLELEKTKLELAENTKRAEQEILLKEHEQKINVGKLKKQTELKEMLDNMTQKLKEAKKELEKIKVFEFGRSQSTKDKQIYSARKKISNFESSIRGIKSEIAELEMHKTFDFQKSPKLVMEYIFKAAIENDFSKLRYLCDPYAENDSDVNGICYAEMLIIKGQDRFTSNFSKGRIIGDPIINGDKAKIEFAFGPSSNKLETMNLVNRNGYWYLSSI
jgi:hypothetical protein